jgi:hypothetical protein
MCADIFVITKCCILARFYGKNVSFFNPKISLVSTDFLKVVEKKREKKDRRASFYEKERRRI